MNVIRVLLGVCMLNRRFYIHLGLDIVLYAYTIKRHSSGKYCFVVEAKLLQIVVNFPNTSKNMS